MGRNAEILSTAEVARLLRRRPETLRAWRMSGAGPPYIRLGSAPYGRVVYRRADIEEFLDRRRFRCVADEKRAAHSRGGEMES